MTSAEKRQVGLFSPPSPRILVAGDITDASQTPEPYLTAGVRSNIFRALGSTHLHVDAEAHLYDELKEIIRKLEVRGVPSKINLVHGFIAGEQRADSDLGAFYDNHTPVNPDSKAESFGIFSTSLITDRRDVIWALGEIMKTFKNTGAVAEFEQIIGRGDTDLDRKWRTIGVTSEVGRLEYPTEVDVAADPSAVYEIHHGFNIVGPTPPVDLKHLVQIPEVSVGGWFISRRPGPDGTNDKQTWAYRSNAFSRRGKEPAEVNTRIKREVEAIESFLRNADCATAVSTTLERTLGVWRL